MSAVRRTVRAMPIEFSDDLPPAEVPPCETCGSPVRMKTVTLPRVLGETTRQTVTQRVCTNRSCRTNTRERTLGDIV